MEGTAGSGFDFLGLAKNQLLKARFDRIDAKTKDKIAANAAAMLKECEGIIISTDAQDSWELVKDKLDKTLPSETVKDIFLSSYRIAQTAITERRSLQEGITPKTLDL